MSEERVIEVLVVEDDEFIVMVYDDLLQGVSNMRFNLNVFSRLDEGIAALRSGKYDVLLLDLNLPDSSATQTISKIPVLSSHIPVVTMTSTVDDVLALKTMNMGGQDYLIKNKLERTLLIRSILYAIERHHLRNQLQQEKEKSDALLRNILPESIADELKIAGSTKARSYDEVSVMFVDFANFTSISGSMEHQDLVNELHECFSGFDTIMEKYGLEKIKTIGDAYMCAGGVPQQDPDHLRNMLRAAFEIMQITEERFNRKTAEGIDYWRARIGIHVGPVVAGVVGSKKFTYDIWGDTVNTAARMESHSEPGKINVSEAVHVRLADAPGFSFTNRGAIEAKGKGLIDMYFATRSFSEG